MCCIFSFNCCLEEIKIDKSGMDVWEKTHYLKRGLLVLGKYFRIKRFYRQCLEKYLDGL